MRPIVAALRKQGFTLLSFYDDFGSTGPGDRPCSKEQATAGRVAALALFATLGVQVHRSKGQVDGTRLLTLLGLVLDTVNQPVGLPPVRVSKLLAAARRLSTDATSSTRWVRRRPLQRFCGLAVSCGDAIPTARLRLHHLHTAQRGKTQWCRLRHGALRELRWWRTVAASGAIGRRLWPPSLGALTTDASQSGWGGHTTEGVQARGHFAPHQLLWHINAKEIEAVTASVLSLTHNWDPDGGVLDLWVDNRVAMHVINNLSTRSRLLHPVLHRLVQALHERNLSLRASWLPSANNFLADQLSRMRDRTDWRLSPAVFAVPEAVWGPHDVDRFATHLSTHLPRFNSRWWCPGAEAIDTFAQPWWLANNYANPPFDLIDPVLDLIAKQDAAATVVLPVWQAQPFWQRATAMASAAFLLPEDCGLTRPGRVQPLARHPHWRLAAFRFLPCGRAPRPSDGGANRTLTWHVPHPSRALAPLPSAAYAMRR